MSVGWSATAIRSPVVVLGVEEGDGRRRGLAKPISDWTASGRDKMMSGLKPAQASAVFGPTSSWKERRDTRKLPTALKVSLGFASREKIARWVLQRLPSQPKSGRWTSAFLPSNSHTDKRNAKRSAS